MLLSEVKPMPFVPILDELVNRLTLLVHPEHSLVLGMSRPATLHAILILTLFEWVVTDQSRIISWPAPNSRAHLFPSRNFHLGLG